MPTYPNGHWNGPEDFEFRFTIDFETIVLTRKDRKTGKEKRSIVGPVFSWKRGRQPVKIGKHLSIARTREAETWAAAAAGCLHRQWPFRQPIPKAINGVPVKLTLQVVSFHPTARLIDASNLYQGPEDAMQACGPKCDDRCKVHAGILEDDVCIENHNDSYRDVDRARPRVELWLRPWRKPE